MKAENRISEEKSNWNDVRSEKLNKQNKNLVESLSNKMDHVRNSVSEPEDKDKKMGHLVKANKNPLSGSYHENIKPFDFDHKWKKITPYQNYRLYL